MKGLFALGTADIIGLSITSVFWLYLSTIMEVEQYGELHYFISIAGIAAVICLVGAKDVIVVYTAKNVKVQPILFLLSFLASGVAFVVIAIFFRMDIGFLLLGYIINELATGYLLGKKQFVNVSKYVLIQKTLLVVVGFGFFHLFGLEGIIFGFALSYIHLLIIIFQVLRKPEFNLKVVSEHKGFIINNYVMAIVVSFRSHLDKIIIVPLLGFTSLGNYSLVLQIFSVMTVFEGILFKYILPNDAAGIPNLKLKKYAIVVAICISMLGVFVLPFFIPIVFPQYTEAVDMLRIISFAVIGTTFVKIYMSKLLGMEKSRFVLYGRTVALLVTIIGILILAPILNTIGLAITFVISAAAHAITLIYFDRKYVHGKIT